MALALLAYSNTDQDPSVEEYLSKVPAPSHAAAARRRCSASVPAGLQDAQTRVMVSGSSAPAGLQDAQTRGSRERACAPT
eukprot:9467996-Pyramimonas_sp.AAC.1